MLSLQKKLSPPSSPQFFIRNKRHKRRGNYVNGGGGACKTNRNERWGGRGSKTGSFEQTHFLNDPYLNVKC